MSGRERARAAGIVVGTHDAGPLNAITDVRGVRVGHTTLIVGDGPLRPGQGPIRTGVTVILPHLGDPFTDKCPAALWVQNGIGECTGGIQLRERGRLETPIALTNTLNVGLVYDALVEWAIDENPSIGDTAHPVIPIVAECNDMYLNDIGGRHVRREHVFEALAKASAGSVEEGNVGGGTGMSSYGYKGGIGTASRRFVLGDEVYTIGVLVQSNFGRRHELTVCGVPVGRYLPDDPGPQASQIDGSIIMVVATDLPLSANQLEKVARRSAFGIARTGSVSHPTSGDLMLAFSTRVAPKEDSDHVLDMSEIPYLWLSTVYAATIEATEEAILNALFQARTMVGRDGHTRYGLPIEEVVDLVTKAHLDPE